MADQLASCSDQEVMSALRPKQLMQTVKAITTFLGQVETLEITAACDECLKACLEFDKAKGNEDPTGKLRPEIVEEVGEHYATVILKSETKVQEDHANKIKSCLKIIQDSIKMLIEVYCKSFRVNFSFVQHQRPKTFQETINIDEPFLLRICALHRIPPDWNHYEYKVSLQIYHGTRPIENLLETNHKSLMESESG